MHRRNYAINLTKIKSFNHFTTFCKNGQVKNGILDVFGKFLKETDNKIPLIGFCTIQNDDNKKAEIVL